MSALATVEYQELEMPEADESLFSPRYLGAVLAKAIRIVEQKLEVKGLELCTILGMQKSKMYRHRRGEPVKPWMFDAVMRQLEDAYAGRRIGAL